MPEIRTCIREGCDKPFLAYPSQYKKYCTPSCRYTSPTLLPMLRESAQRMHTALGRLHLLTEINPQNRTAICLTCGLTRIRPRKEIRKYSTVQRWRCRTAERVRAWAQQYGVTKDFIFNLLETQNHCCAICIKPLDASFHVDHDHETNQVRGLLCNQCNTGLGLFQDCAKTLRAAADYLEVALANID